MLSQPMMTPESLAEFFCGTELNEFEFAGILQLTPSPMCQHLATVLNGLRGIPDGIPKWSAAGRECCCLHVTATGKGTEQHHPPAMCLRSSSGPWSTDLSQASFSAKTHSPLRDQFAWWD